LIGRETLPASLAAKIRRLGLLFAFLTLCIVLSILSDRFRTLPNALNILRQSSVNGIIAAGITLVILTGGIDLSVGSVLALSSMIAAQLLVKGVFPPIAFLCGLSIGALLGLFNGTLVTRFSLPPFVATLGTMTFARGLALSFTQGKPITGLPESFRVLGTGFAGPIPVPVIILLAIFLVGILFLKLTPQGERLYALGNNPIAARFTGIPIETYIVVVYCIAGVLAALAGQILIGRLNSAQPVMGMGYELDAIAAVVVGGTDFSGGRGGLMGTLIGVLLIVVINNGSNLLDIPSFWGQVVKGVIIAAALLLNRASISNE